MSELGTRSEHRGPYAERTQAKPNWIDETAIRLTGPVVRRVKSRSFGSARFVREVASLSRWAADLKDDQILAVASELGVDLRRTHFSDALVARSFSLIREVAGRTLGQRHFDVQILGGRVLLKGMVAEMVTGEGKTLTATLPAATAALAGVPVHIITVNDYLASRDAEWMGPIYEALGLKVGTIVHGLDPEARRSAYRADVTYCTNKEITFDYLRDRILLARDTDRARLEAERLYEDRPRIERLLLRGLHYGIVDEVDSVLVDEARTPLIISGSRTADDSEQKVYRTALRLATELEEGRHFRIESREREVKLLPASRERLDNAAQSLGGVWARRQWREELVRKALTALHLFHEQKHYLVKDDKVQIIDEYTGRVMPDRSWEHGLHQMIEVKEDCTLTRRIDPLARISYQRFFRRYLWLAGMTGTAQEVSGELWSVYRLATARVPTNRPLKRQRWPIRVYSTQKDKWRAIVDRIAEIHGLGRPILVGTRSVKASEHLGGLLDRRGLDYQLLNARQDIEEAKIIARAGERGRITVATNMAGRGTDIQLEPGVSELGGLHVIATELHEARRIDRQLFGRCGRQGDPGSFEAVVSLEDELADVYASRVGRALGRTLLGRSGKSRAGTLPILNLRMAQRSAERLHRRMRRDLLRLDEQLESTLAFAGKSE